jgi:hypothetical protein
MEPGAIFLLFVVLLLAVLFVIQPFTKHWHIKAQSSHEISALLAERERALNALTELDFDKGIDKIPVDEYFAQRASLIQKGSEIIRRLDEIRGKHAAPVEEKATQASSEQDSNLPSDEDLEDLIARRRTMRNQKAAGFCPNCGKPILQSDKFCPSCGQIVNSI